MGRATQGVRIIKISDKDEIADVALIKETESDEDESVEENTTED